ncbi:MAG: 4Fe-4S dicluster domain-containing protein [Candidatus Lokiarchaeota archaeon]|nr:4Fe-4S dicluster domain-containing protein [Candidatus Lokiarchaeota archaeon]
MVLDEIKEEEFVGSVLIIGGGVSGIQAALDLANIGFKIYIVEKRESLGGKMAQIGGKTAAFDPTCLSCLLHDESSSKYPTNDCALNIFIPKMVEANFHKNITILAYSEVKEINGKPGNFKVKILKKARYVDETRCHGCGDCSNVCPVSFPNDFELGMAERKAIDVPFPQAIPLIYSIDKDHCLKFTENKCGLCKLACKAYAIDFNQKDEVISLDVGAIIVATGFETLDLEKIPSYGSQYKNVITALEYERLLSAFGPTRGEILRPSDNKEPKRIAFISCVGSRSVKKGVPYCSNVCCMYIAKQCVLTRKSFPEIECKVFKSDIQVFRKGFNEFYEKAKSKYDIKYTDARVGYIEEDPVNNDLIIHYEDIKNNKLVEYRANMVVLAVALVPTDEVNSLAKILNIETDKTGFFKEKSHFMPVNSTRKGIYICGCSRGPKDIPSSVVEGSSAASKAAEFLESVKGSEIKTKVYKTNEKEISPIDEPRIGVLICTCGMNLKSVLSVYDLIEYTKSLPDVVKVETSIFACAEKARDHIKRMINKFELNRFIIAACSARLHEAPFQDAVRAGGLNPHLFELVNIRDHCYWVHSYTPELATDKAKKLIKMAVSKTIHLEPVNKIRIRMKSTCLIVGSGISGLTASLSIANQGYHCVLVEKRSKIGPDITNYSRFITPLENPEKFLENVREKVIDHPNIRILGGHVLTEIKGSIGNFRVHLISLKNNEVVIEKASTIIIAIGAKEFKPIGYYNYGIDKRVITQLELSNLLSAEEPPEDTVDLIENTKNIVMIQCVGARETGKRGYCSRTCCFNALVNSLSLKKKYPSKNIFILYRDIVMPDKYGEELYRKARKSGVTFIRYFPENKPKIKSKRDKIIVKIEKSGEIATLNTNLLVLSTPMELIEENKTISRILDIPYSEKIGGFYLKAHVKVLPLDLNKDGIFICGTARGPTTLDESIIESLGASSRAATILTKKSMYNEGMISKIDQDKCIGCGKCVAVCTNNAIEIISTDKSVDGTTISIDQAKINEKLCKGCGKCVSACPVQAISAKNFTNIQILEMIKIISEKNSKI